jgi:hypothetical protein
VSSRQQPVRGPNVSYSLAMRHVALTLALTAALSAVACSAAATSPTSLTNPLLGTWASVTSAAPTPGTCTNFQWTVTQVNGTTGSGAFSATCAGALQFTGTGTGTLTGTAINWSVAGNATGSGNGSCAVAASGSASLQSDGSILIPYNGTTCVGPVSGTQVITRR